MKPINSFWLARSIQKHVKRLKSAGYSHPPIFNGEGASFRVSNHNGDRFEVIVRPVSIEEELNVIRNGIRP